MLLKTIFNIERTWLRPSLSIPAKAYCIVSLTASFAFSLMLSPFSVKYIWFDLLSAGVDLRSTNSNLVRLSTRRVILGLSLNVASHNVCCETPSWRHKNERTVHYSGVISKPCFRKLRYIFLLIAIDTFPFMIGKIYSNSINSLFSFS